MLPVLLDRQDTCHVRQRDIGFVLQKIPQEVQIFRLRLLILLVDAENAVPLVDDHDERDFRLRINRRHIISQVHSARHLYVRINTPNVLAQILNNNIDHTIHIAFRSCQKILHIQLENIVFVQMLPIRIHGLDF